MAAAAPAARRKEDIIRVSADLAADDAAHDFSGARGTPAAQGKLKALAAKILGGAAPIPSFRGNLYKREVGIGTIHPPTFPRPADIHHEWDAFTMVTGKTKAELQATPRQTFKTGEDFDYVCTRKVIHGAGRAWTQNAKELFDWLVAETPDQNNLYFCIDAVNVKFYEIFEGAQNAGAAEKARTLHYLNYREGTNDSAGKPSLDFLVAATAAKPVKVRTYEDTAVGHILYPRYSDDTKDLPNSQFNSIFSITVKNEKQADGIKSTLTSYFSEKFSSSIQVVKGRKEEHPNAVNSLIPRLIQAFKDIFREGGKGTPEERFKFFQTLHQKRSGDWFQVLATDDTARFAAVADIPAGSMVILFTEDIIAAAYAALTGKNVCLTTVGAEGSGELILLLRTRPAGTAEEILRAKSLAFEELFLERDISQFTRGAAAAVPLQDIAGTFNATYAATEKAIKDRIETAKTALTTWVDNSQKQGIRVAQLKTNKALTDKIRDLLRELFELASFYNYIQPLPSIADITARVNEYTKAFIALKAYRDGLAADAAPNPQLAEADMNRLRLTHAFLSAVQARVHLYVDAGYTDGLVGGYPVALNRAMTKLFTVGPASSQKAKHKKEIEAIINRFFLFDTLFQRSNSATNSIALFQFLSTIPDRAYLGGVKKYLDAILAGIRTLVGGAASEETHLETFKKTFGFLTNGNAVEVLGRDEAPEAEILQCLLENDEGYTIKLKEGRKKLRRNAAAEAAAGAAAAAPNADDENDGEGGKNINVAPAAPAPLAGRKRKVEQIGGDTAGLTQGRIEFLYSLFTPSLRILKGQAAAVLGNEEDYLEQETRFVIAAAGGAGAGENMNSEGENNDEEPETPPPGEMEEAQGGGGHTTLLPLSLHPLTYIFFYVRECLLQLEVESSDYEDWLRIGQLLNLYKEILARAPATLRKSPFAERIYYGTLVQLLLGWAPQTVKQGHREIQKFRKTLGLSDATLAALTGSVNESYFGQPSIRQYRLSDPTQLQRNLFRLVRTALKDVKPLRTEAQQSRLYEELEEWIEEIPSTIEGCISGEQKELYNALLRSQKQGTKTTASKRYISGRGEVKERKAAAGVGGGTRRRGRKRRATRLNSRRRIRR